MGTQGTGRKRIPNRERLSGEDDALNQIAREAEARLAAKRAARAEAREIRMKELERQQKEIYQVQKKYYGLDNKWGDIEQWMEDSEKYSRRARRNTSASDDEERMSVGSRGSLRGNHYSSDLYNCSGLSSKPQTSTQNGSRPSMLCSNGLPSRSIRGSLHDDSMFSGTRRFSASSSRAPSEYSGFLGSSSRASSRASSARASPVVEERPERDFVEKGSRSTSTLSAATLASLGGTSSRRGSGDTSISVDTEASIREIKDSLAEVEEKYRKAMVSNAQLDNEKTNLLFQVDTLKDSLIELEEQLAETRREYEEKSKQYERERHAHSVLQFQFSEMKKTLQQTEELLAEVRQLHLKQESYVREISDLQETIEWKDKKIGALERQKEYADAIRNERDELREEVVMLKDLLKKHGIVPGLEVTTNGEAGSIIIDGPAESETVTMEIQDSAQGSQSPDGVIEIRLRKLVDERENLIEQIRKLKLQLEDKQRVGNMEITTSEPVVIENGTDAHVVDLQRDTNRQISDLKFKLVKSEQEVTALEQNVIRLEGQVTRYKCAAENSEKIEDELKAEKRKLQRELRTALDKIDELEVSNSHLVKRLEKMKANRSALLSQQ